ncbi:hypothetical protein BD560DRAFT_401665 [Blakeslea trispora]|nr:hypothetical protein BD560DRAFT_401665 [Blakeslea trispora]
MSTGIDQLHERLTPAHIRSLTEKCPQHKGSQNKIKDQHTAERGQHYVATEKIQQGELLMTEEPFIRQLNKDHWKDHCYYCFGSLNSSVINCRNTDCKWLVHYCSKVCEERSWFSIHYWLCDFPELQNQDCDVLFAFQGFIAGQTKTLPGLISNQELHGKNTLADYREKFNMLSNIFHLSSSIVDTLVTIFCQIRCNTFAVKQARNKQVGADLVVEREHIILGRAVYLMASKLNHDCDPNSIVSFGNGDINLCQMQVRCSKKQIDPKQEITISYGPLASVHSQDERQKKLKQDYFFDCRCSSCEDKNQHNPDAIYKCQFCKTGKMYRQQFKCPECQQEAHWPYFIKTESEIEMYMQQYNFLKVLELQSALYHPHTIVIGETMDRLAQLYCMQGDMKTASVYSRKSLDIVQHVHGKISIEAAEEMMKLSTLLLNACITGHRQLKQEAMTHIKQTMITYRLLGLDKSAPEDMEELQTALTHLMIVVR